MKGHHSSTTPFLQALILCPPSQFTFGWLSTLFRNRTEPWDGVQRRYPLRFQRHCMYASIFRLSLRYIYNGIGLMPKYLQPTKYRCNFRQVRQDSCRLRLAYHSQCIVFHFAPMRIT